MTAINMHFRLLKCLILICFAHVAMAQEMKVVFQSIAWFPSGDVIAFSAIKVKSDWSDYSPDKWNLYTYDLNTRKVTRLCNVCIYFSVSRDGGQIYYDKALESGKDIFSLDVMSGESRPVVTNPGKDAGPSVSPDGRYLVFYSDEDGNEELYKIDLTNGEIKQLTQRPEDKSYNPAWSPVSGQIVYYLEKGDHKDQIYLTDSEGSFDKNLTQDEHHNVFPSWTPDGRIIYIRDKGEVMIMNADGTQKEQLLENSGGLAAMSPDGAILLFVSADGSGLSIKHLASGQTEQLFVSDEIDLE